MAHRIRSVASNPGHSMSTCTRCKKPLPADAMGGVCPACLLGLARPERLDPGQQPTRDRHEPDPSKYPTPAELGRWLPQYRIDELIGQGGMGAVYRGHQPGLDRPVAIKIMAPRFADDPSFAERFSREARTMARLNHQNIINVYDYGQAGPVCFLVMEFVEGINLRRAMQNGELTAEQALAIVPQVCEALQFAHDEGIVHRDIKPENILLDRKGRVKIADFGLAKLVQEDSPQWTLTGSRQVLGTVNYMAPEQIERPGAVDHRADIYSLGVVLYELLTGELPLGRFPLPSERSRATAALDEVVLRSLEKEPQRRYQQASEVRSAVELVRNSSGFRPLGEPGVQASRGQPAAAIAPQTGNAAWASPAAAPPAPAAAGTFRFRVPFTIEDPNWGITVTHGTIKLAPLQGAIKLPDQKLLIEYATQDNIFHAIPIGSGQHEISLGDILQADFRDGYFSGRLILVLDRLQPLSGLPGEKPGRIHFSIASDDKSQARQLVNTLRQHTGQPILPGTLDKPEDRRKAALKAVGWPATGLIIAGVFNLVLIPLLFLVFMLLPSEVVRQAPAVSSDSVAADVEQAGSDVPVVPDQESGTPSVPEASEWVPLDPSAQKATVGSNPILYPPRITALQLMLNGALCLAYMLIGGLLVSGGVNMLRLRRRGWSIAMSILALVPIHPGFLIGLPAGIFALVQLARPMVREQFDQPALPA
jgi:serine/threonine protein kinase